MLVRFDLRFMLREAVAGTEVETIKKTIALQRMWTKGN